MLKYTLFEMKRIYLAVKNMKILPLKGSLIQLNFS